MLRFKLQVFALPSLLLLSGCGFFDWADEHMPVIGQRCENWQCFTSNGQTASRLKEQSRMRPAENPTSAVSAMPADASAPATPAGGSATQPLAPPAGSEGAYKYVPRQPEPSGTVPLE